MRPLRRNKSTVLLFCQRFVTGHPRCGSMSLYEVAWGVSGKLKLPMPLTKESQWALLFHVFDTRVTEVAVDASPVVEVRKKRIRAASNAFLMSAPWRRLRMLVITKRGRRCECCGATPQQDGITINVDHIKPRQRYPELALVEANLQILCNVCNHGKGNGDETDWRR